MENGHKMAAYASIHNQQPYLVKICELLQLSLFITLMLT